MRVASLLAIGLILAACESGESPPLAEGGPAGGEEPAAARTGALRELRSADGTYSFYYPAGWTAEDHEGGTLLLAPEQAGGWQAHLFFEAGSDPEGRTPLDGARDLIGGLMEQKAGFAVSGVATLRIERGVAARVMYEHRDADLKLVGWEVVAAPEDEGSDLRVFVTASATADRQREDLARFERILSTLRVTDPEAEPGEGEAR